jgi:hypothetical protein
MGVGAEEKEGTPNGKKANSNVSVEEDRSVRVCVCVRTWGLPP